MAAAASEVCKCYRPDQSVLTLIGDRQKSICKFTAQGVDRGVGVLIYANKQTGDFRVLTALHVVDARPVDSDSPTPIINTQLRVHFPTLIEPGEMNPVPFELKSDTFRVSTANANDRVDWIVVSLKYQQQAVTPETLPVWSLSRVGGIVFPYCGENSAPVSACPLTVLTPTQTISYVAGTNEKKYRMFGKSQDANTVGGIAGMSGAPIVNRQGKLVGVYTGNDARGGRGWLFRFTGDGRADLATVVAQDEQLCRDYAQGAQPPQHNHQPITIQPTVSQQSTQSNQTSQQQPPQNTQQSQQQSVEIIAKNLMEEVKQSRIDVVEQTLKSNSSVLKAKLNADGMLLIHVAARYSSVSMCQRLINYGADGQTLLNDNTSCLHLAAQYNTMIVCKFFLKTIGIDVNQRDASGYTALHRAAQFNGDVAVLQELINNNADVNQLALDGESPLSLAAKGTNLQICLCLMMNDAKIDQRIMNIVAGKSNTAWTMQFIEWQKKQIRTSTRAAAQSTQVSAPVSKKVQPAQEYLDTDNRLSMIEDAVVTPDEFREFCNSFGIAPSDRMRFSQLPSNERVISALRLWYKKNPTVGDLKLAIEQWGHKALLQRLGLVDSASSSSTPTTTSSTSSSNSKKSQTKSIGELQVWIHNQLTVANKEEILFLLGVPAGQASTIASRGMAEFWATLAQHGKCSAQSIDADLWSSFPAIRQKILEF